MDVQYDADLRDGPGREFLGAQRVEIGDGAVVFFQDLVIGDLDPFPAVGLDGEDAHPEHAAAVVLQQGGVAQPAHDILVYAPGLGGVEKLGPGFPAVDPHAEVPDHGAFGQGEQVIALEAGIVGIVELLVDDGGGQLPLDRDADIVPYHLQRKGRGRPRHRPGRGE